MQLCKLIIMMQVSTDMKHMKMMTMKSMTKIRTIIKNNANDEYGDDEEDEKWTDDNSDNYAHE